MFPQLNRWQRLPSLTRGQEAGARVSTKGTSPPPSGTQRRTVMTEGYTEGRPRKPSENTLGLISGKKSSTNGAVFPSEAVGADPLPGKAYPVEMALDQARVVIDQISPRVDGGRYPAKDRKSTRLNSSHVAISYAVFC